MSEEVRIEPLTDRNDLPRCAHLSDIALKNDGLHALFERYGPAPVYDDCLQKMQAALEDPHCHCFKAVVTNAMDGSEEIVGFTSWYVGYVQVPKVDRFAPQPVQETQMDAGPDNIAVVDENGEALLGDVKVAVEISSKASNPATELFRLTGNSYVATIRGKKHVYLRRMIVHPDHQRKGIGQRLIQWGVDVADQEKIVGWLLARPPGIKLYERAGWKAILSTHVEIPGIDMAPVISMLRTPQPRKGIN